MLGSASYLNWSDEVIETAVGVQQGDPLTPVLFCMVLKKVINAITDSCALDINLWFLDDGVIAGPAKEVSRALDVIEQVVFRLHLSENREKPSWGVANDSPDGRTAITPSCPNSRRCSCPQPPIAIPHQIPLDRNRLL
jgi:hypothetical protein